MGHRPIILAFRGPIEGIKSNNLPAIITFIDRMAIMIDNMHRGEKLKILNAYGIPDLIVEAIENTRAKVFSPDGDTDLFYMTFWQELIEEIPWHHTSL